MAPYWYVVIALILIAILCTVFAVKEPDLGRVKKEMCINADVMDEENFGKPEPC